MGPEGVQDGGKPGWIHGALPHDDHKAPHCKLAVDDLPARDQQGLEAQGAVDQMGSTGSEEFDGIRGQGSTHGIQTACCALGPQQGFCSGGPARILSAEDFGGPQAPQILDPVGTPGEGQDRKLPDSGQIEHAVGNSAGGGSEQDPVRRSRGQFLH